MNYDKIIIGAGIYGLYAAVFCGERGEKVLVIEKENEAFKRATYINQARVHNGYHYPRSYSTAIKSAKYFQRFHENYGFSELTEFDQIYATSKNFSWTNAEQFKKFCNSANIKCEEVYSGKYFKDGLVDGSFLTKEYTYDAKILKDYFLEKINKLNNVKIEYNCNITNIVKKEKTYQIILDTKESYESGFILNATYASINQILSKLDYETFKIKYELCEIIICSVNEKLKNTGITVMDGPFFSIMPFGKTGYHSLTSVTFTPHTTSYEKLPNFECQMKSNGFCTKENLGNCNECLAKPKTAWNYMSSLAKKYLKDEYKFEYKKSLFSIKPILIESEIDDSRPTVIKKFSEDPTFVTVLSGKINTIFDLDEVLI